MDNLQDNVTIGKTAIRGDLKYVNDYTGFSSNPTEQAGNYLVLHCECEGADAITVELLGGKHGPVTLDEDGLIILKIANDHQRVKVTASADGHESVTKTYTLTGLTLEPAN